MTPRSKRLNTGGGMAGVLRELRDAGGSVTQREFTRILARHYSTANSMDDARKSLRSSSMVVTMVHMTASGSVKLQEAEDRQARAAQYGVAEKSLRGKQHLFRGSMLTISEIAATSGLSVDVIRKRMAAGCVDDDLVRPKRRHLKR